MNFVNLFVVLTFILPDPTIIPHHETRDESHHQFPSRGVFQDFFLTFSPASRVTTHTQTTTNNNREYQPSHQSTTNIARRTTTTTKKQQFDSDSLTHTHPTHGPPTPHHTRPHQNHTPQPCSKFDLFLPPNSRSFRLCLQKRMASAQVLAPLHVVAFCYGKNNCLSSTRVAAYLFPPKQFLWQPSPSKRRCYLSSAPKLLFHNLQSHPHPWHRRRPRNSLNPKANINLHYSPHQHSQLGVPPERSAAEAENQTCAGTAAVA